MRKNKTSLTAHHFLSAPSDRPIPLIPRHLVCFTGTSSECIPPSPTCLLLPLPWPVTDSSVQSINPRPPQPGPMLCWATNGRDARATARIPESVTLNGINIWRWRGRERRRSNQSTLCLPYTDPPVIGWPLQQKKANETPELHLNTKRAAHQSDLITVDGPTEGWVTGELKCLLRRLFELYC